MKKKLTFYIWAPDYDVFSGGNVALHKLTHLLTQLGERAILLCNSKNPEWLGELYDYHPIDYLNSIVVYPEIIIGNPNNFRYVMRWILNTPGVLGGDGIFGKDDLIYKFVNYFHVADETKVRGELRNYNLQLNKFVDHGHHIPGKTCYIVRKGKDKVLNQHPEDAICLDNYQHEGGIDYLVQVFNECERFISYDHITFISAQAVLCGCDSIVIPDGVSTKEEWKASASSNRYGIAYGFDDREWARQTRDKAIELITGLETESVVLTKQFIKDSYRHVYTWHNALLQLEVTVGEVKKSVKKYVKTLIGRK